MPLPTITGVPPEVWEQVLQILQQFGVTVWDLTEQGITTWEGAGGLKEYLLNHGWELKEVWDLKYMWFQTGAADATQSNALVQYVANEVTIAGAAGAQYVKHFTYGGSTIGKLKKGVVFGSIFALLVSSLDPSFITDALKGRLNRVIDRFADDNDEVPVIVGEDGKTYYHEDMINALRQELIDAGVYSSGTDFPDYQTSGSVTITSLSSGRDLLEYALSKLENCNYSIPDSVKQAMYDFIDNNNGKAISISVYDAPLSSSYEGYSPLSIEAYNASVGRTFTLNSTTFLQSTFRTEGKKVAGQNTMTLRGYRSTTDTGQRIKYIGETRQDNSIMVSNINASTGGGGVEGITVASDLIQRGIGDISTALDDVFPSYAADKITTINPSDEDITGHEDWYPISTADNDVWTDGITEQQSETATDGEVTPDIQTQLADAIKQILEDYYRDPTDPTVINYPEIETGDSGDTPPENPPLIPPSDVTGSNGLWSIYNPSLQNVNDFGAWLWSDSLADQFKRIFNSPIDGVIGFHMLYCTPSTGTAKPIKCGFLQSPVSAPVVTNPYVEIDCGTVSINEYYRNAMDYDNTRISVYLPFIGIVPLDTNIVMGSDINITYRIDVLTGTCLAQIKVIKENSDAVMYAFDGNCAVQIPLTATTYTGMIGALLGGISAGASIMTGNMVQAIGSGVRALASGMTGLSGAKQSGTFGANVGALGIRIPYVIITHPVSAMPGQFNKLEGIPSNNVVVLGSLSGYTRVRSVHLENIGKATQEEINMIEELLKEGVII